ncbi:procollagen-lysine,2-oxoglutarate 5-dioxygenase 1-like [Tubulanus polymorphus]|uniref:procollagen-lysine,2-oxoglutarate 5-dioxygenase 1-like n=1 Tax=Tubulanus polymorphus TaxID=672921 RepID=UPI003DA3D635
MQRVAVFHPFYGRFCVALMIICGLQLSASENEKEDLIVFTVATENTDGFQRFMRSAKKYDYNVKVLGMGTDWLGGNMEGLGGGQKVKLLSDALEPYKDDENLLVMFVDSYDLVFTQSGDEIKKLFTKMDAKVVFGAEDFCWPDQSLISRYPAVRSNEKKYLNSGGFIGYASTIYQIVTNSPIDDDEDDQLYYTRIFLDEDSRDQLKIKLDTKAEIFQNLNGALDEVTLKFKGENGFLYNTRTGSTPVVIHGNGPIKPEFNRLTNYLAKSWTPVYNCLVCKEEKISLKGLKEEDYPTVQISIFIEFPTPFLDIFFQRLVDLIYPKSKIDIFLHCKIRKQMDVVNKFMEDHKPEYNSFTVVDYEGETAEETARNKAVDECLLRQCQYMFVVDSEAQFTNPKTLQLLIEQNRSIIAPLLVRPGRMWSNFWGAITKVEFYQRSEDYSDIVSGNRVGVWNVPHIGVTYLIQAHKLAQMKGIYSKDRRDADLAFASNLRKRGMFMYLMNMNSYGHLINNENYDLSPKHPDLYQIFDNRPEWEMKYIHSEHLNSLKDDYVPKQPCPDVYWFPVVTAKYCWDLIDEMENFGKWSGGKNEDTRLATGYENVPTVDIHMNQISYDRHWLEFLRLYIQPLQQKVYTGYFHDPPQAVMNFVVRYKPTEQPLLRPHHDSSTYTLNMALNRANVDYEGGGARFIRYDCAVRNTRQGWGLLHPGRLTHYHEGLRTTNGTRYIMVSFIDP